MPSRKASSRVSSDLAAAALPSAFVCDAQPWIQTAEIKTNIQPTVKIKEEVKKVLADDFARAHPNGFVESLKQDIKRKLIPTMPAMEDVTHVIKHVHSVRQTATLAVESLPAMRQAANAVTTHVASNLPPLMRHVAQVATNHVASNLPRIHEATTVATHHLMRPATFATHTVPRVAADNVSWLAHQAWSSVPSLEDVASKLPRFIRFL